MECWISFKFFYLITFQEVLPGESTRVLTSQDYCTIVVSAASNIEEQRCITNLSTSFFSKPFHNFHDVMEYHYYDRSGKINCKTNE